MSGFMVSAAEGPPPGLKPGSFVPGAVALATALATALQCMCEGMLLPVKEQQPNQPEQCH